MREIAESDWKLWKQTVDVAYARFCQQALAEIGQTASNSEDVFDRYKKIKAILKAADKKLEEAFGPFRRSTALQQLAYAVAEGMVTQEELSQFSDEAQQIVKLWLRE